MKKLLFGLIASISILSLAGCSDDSSLVSSPNDDSSVQDSTSSDSTDSSSPDDTYDFTTSLSSNGVSADEESYLISTISQSDISYAESNYFKASLTFSCDSTWNLVTGLNSNYTILVSEDQDVIPDEAMELSTILDSDVNGSSGSNEIIGFRIRINRSLIQEGETQVLLQVRPANGSTSIAGTTANLCVPVTVKEYGTIELDTHTADLTIDLSNLDDTTSSYSSIESMTFYMTQLDSVYGASKSYNLTQDLLDLDDDQLVYESIEFPIGYDFTLFILIDDASTGSEYLNFRDAGSSDGYSVTIETSSTTLSVLEDGADIKLTLN